MSLRQFWLGLAVLTMLAATTVSGDEPPRLRRVAGTGDPAPGGGVFDRFGAESMPIVAPVNARGDVAFFSTLGRAGADEGFFLWSRGRITAVARSGTLPKPPPKNWLKVPSIGMGWVISTDTTQALKTFPGGVPTVSYVFFTW